MRSFGSVLFLSLFGLVAACAGSSEDTGAATGAETSKADESVAYGPCGYTRAELIAQVSKSRGDAITRGFEWLDEKVPFSKAATHDKYRTDCSGFVSMCWQLGAPGETTSTFGTKSSGTTKLSSYDDLVPADALVWPGHHSMIFLGWNDTAHKGACVLEQASTASDMQFRVRLTASLKGSAFVPVRNDDFSDDTDYTPATHTKPSTGSSTSTSGGSTTGTGTGTTTGGSSGSSGSDNSGDDDSTTTTTPPTTTTCKPYDATQACNDAYNNRGIECGTIYDGCGGTIDCITVYPSGCGTGKECSANKCVNTVCVPQTAEVACAAAKTKYFYTCGAVADGCGGTVSCDDLADFGCATGQTCANNKCYAAGSAPASTSTTTGATTTTNTVGNLTPASDEDNGDNAPTTPVASEEDSTTPKRTMTSSAGCNAAPGAGMDLAPLAGLAIVIGALRRRSKKAA